jgi:O-acetyl-ADP-ribose deacetylase (regulator of RNase III)
VGRQHDRSARHQDQPKIRPTIRYDAVRQCLRHLATHATRLTASVHMPRIGAGLAGGRWDHIEPLITSELTSHDIPVTVYDTR